MIRLQQWRISCVTSMVQWRMMSSGSMPVRNSYRMPRWLLNVVSWIASSNWLSTQTRMETFCETSERTIQISFCQERSLKEWLEIVPSFVCMTPLFSRVLQEHISRLSKVVTANHKALQIPEVTALGCSTIIFAPKSTKIINVLLIYNVLKQSVMLII